MDDAGLDALRRAGRIARKAREKSLSIVREGVSLIEVCSLLEGLILDEGAKPAFPCNICINDVAAHYTPMIGDTSIIPSRSLVKIDIGVCVDGYIADTAISISLDMSLQPMVEAVNSALLEAVKIVKPGIQASMIGGVIQRVITSRGFKPIRNLTGHEIARYNLHAGLSIPNIQTARSEKLQLNHVYAIEPFATTSDGGGEVVSSNTTTIYRLNVEKLKFEKLEEEEKKLLELIYGRFNGLPYTPRWIPDFEKFSKIHERIARMGKIYSYPVLVERKGKPVAQAEHTIIVTERGCEVIT
ncbi:MAG: type II methionyl aminopeptidase [Thaumarchaeota archaeon]|jgi:methionyl aminopeptidase|nr:type II methionyl aminopeptidase [Candidatus Geocrenenecus arthurdayi]